MIESYLNAGYDVVFNYIVNPENLKEMKERFLDLKFVILIADEDELLKRDLLRPENCQMRDRCLILLESFKTKDYGKDYLLDTTNLSIGEMIDIFEKEDRFSV